MYRNLYVNSGGKTKQQTSELTSPLDPAIRTMYQEYIATSKQWGEEGSRALSTGPNGRWSANCRRCSSRTT